MDRYSKLEPIAGEEKYTEYDKEFSCWAVFGLDSGFCYRQFDSKEQAEQWLETTSKN